MKTETLLRDEDVATVARSSVPQPHDLTPSALTAPNLPTDAASLLPRLQRIMLEYRWMARGDPPTADMFYPSTATALEDARRCARLLVTSLEAM